MLNIGTKNIRAIAGAVWLNDVTMEMVVILAWPDLAC